MVGDLYMFFSITLLKNRTPHKTGLPRSKISPFRATKQALMSVASMSHELESLCPTDRDLFHRFGHGSRIEAKFSLVHQAFEDVVDTHPSLVAAEHDGNTVTYIELERLSNLLANSLIRNGLQPRQRVCLVLQRSIDMVVAILAVIKCGCQYVPLDGGVVPDSVMSHIFEDTQAQYVLCLEKFHDKVQQCAGSTTTIVVLDAPKDEKSSSSERPAVNVDSSDGLYIIYTSGNACSFLEASFFLTSKRDHRQAKGR